MVKHPFYGRVWVRPLPPLQRRETDTNIILRLRVIFLKRSDVWGRYITVPLNYKIMMGYKQMLRDRMPLLMSLALKYCKAKDDWINQCYNRFICTVPQTERSTAVKEMLGLAKRPGCKKLFTPDDYIILALYGYKRKQIPTPDKSKLYYTFRETIDWDSLDSSEVAFWEGVCNVVDWFSKSYAYIENDYRISVTVGKHENEIRNELQSRYKLDNALTSYLIKCFKEYG